MITSARQFSKIPGELKRIKAWVIWKQDRDSKTGKLTKVPYQPGKVRARTNDPNTLSSFAAVVAAIIHPNYAEFDGIGFVISETDQYTGVDLDNCLDEHGQARDWALPIIKSMESCAYGEISPSGTGIKFTTKAKKPVGAVCLKVFNEADRQQLECYDKGRFWAMTGEVYGDAKTIRGGQSAISGLCQSYLINGGVKQVDNVRLKQGSNTTLPNAKSCEAKVDNVNFSSDAELSDEDKLREAIPHIPIKYASSYHDWKVVAMVAKHVNQSLRDIWVAWSRDGKGYASDEDCIRHWNATTNPDRVGIGTLVEWAKESGWKPSWSQSKSSPQDAFGPIDANEQKTKEETIEEELNRLLGSWGYDPPMNAMEIANADLRMEYLINGLVPKDQSVVIAGPAKSFKTTLALEIGICLASKWKVFGQYEVPEQKRVMMFSAESGKAKLKQSAERISDSLGFAFGFLNQWFHMSFWVPKAKNTELMRIFELHLKIYRPEVLLLDPLYLSLDGEVMANLSLNSQQIAALCGICERYGCTPLVVDHIKKTSQNAQSHKPLDLVDLQGSGKAEFFRAWLLISHRARFDEKSSQAKLWMTAGGSYGHSNLLAIDVVEQGPDEGRPGFYRSALAETGTDDGEDKQARRKAEQQKEDDKRAELRNSLYEFFMVDKQPKTANQLQSFSRNKLLNSVILDLKEIGAIEVVTQKATNGKFVDHFVMNFSAYVDRYKPPTREAATQK